MPHYGRIQGRGELGRNALSVTGATIESVTWSHTKAGYVNAAKHQHTPPLLTFTTKTLRINPSAWLTATWI